MTLIKKKNQCVWILRCVEKICNIHFLCNWFILYSLFLFLMKYALDIYSFFLEIQTISKISKVLRSVKLHLGKKLKYWSKWKCSFFKTAFFREVMHFHLILISHAYNNRVCVIMAHTTSSMFFTFNWIWKKQ